MVRSAHGQDSIPPDGTPEAVQPRWRKDFPIDWPQDQYVARRDFTKFLVLTSFAFSFGQFWILFQNFKRKRAGAPPIRPIARVAEIPLNSARTFAYPDAHDNCILVRREDGSFLAFDQRCTHLACAVTPEPEKGRLFCPCHNGAFDLATGRPIAGPPRRPLPKVLLETRDGVLYATGVEERTV